MAKKKSEPETGPETGHAADPETGEAAPSTEDRTETIITDLPHGRGRARVTRNLDTGEQTVEVIEEHFHEHRVNCPHCGGVVIIPMEIEDGEEEVDNE